jgi:hypothetical protein
MVLAFARLAVSSTLLLTNLPARAHWDDLGLSSDGDQLQVLRQTQAGVRGVYRSATLRLVLRPHALQDPRNGRWVADIASEWEFDCSVQTGVIRHSRIHYDDGSSKKSDADTGVRALSPDSLVYAEMRALCEEIHGK